MIRKALCFFLLLFFKGAVSGQAQTGSVKHDTAYYKVYADKLAVTPFFTKTVNSFSLSSRSETGTPLRYFTNKPLTLGLRLSYDFLALQGSFGLSSLDPNYSKEKGKTKTLTLQTTFATRKLLIDLYLQQFKGMHIRENDEPSLMNAQIYTRPDIKSGLAGLTGQYVFNGDRFSTRPPVRFDARQLRSAGSFLAGFEFLYGTMKGDSALTPSQLSATYPQADIARARFILFGPSIGYGYTFVVNQSFYFSLIGSINGDVTRTRETSMAGSDHISWKLSPNFNARAGIGYNQENWQIGLSGLTNRIFLKGSNEDARYFTNNNIYRLSFTKRLNAGKTIPRVVGFVGNIIEALGLGFLIR